MSACGHPWIQELSDSGEGPAWKESVHHHCESSRGTRLDDCARAGSLPLLFFRCASHLDRARSHFASEAGIGWVLLAVHALWILWRLMWPLSLACHHVQSNHGEGVQRWFAERDAASVATAVGTYTPAMQRFSDM